MICVHHWKLADPTADTKGEAAKCKKCGEERTFHPYETWRFTGHSVGEPYRYGYQQRPPTEE